jgi:hypothetical protein
LYLLDVTILINKIFLYPNITEKKKIQKEKRCQRLSALVILHLHNSYSIPTPTCGTHLYLFYPHRSPLPPILSPSPLHSSATLDLTRGALIRRSRPPDKGPPHGGPPALMNRRSAGPCRPLPCSVRCAVAVLELGPAAAVTCRPVLQRSPDDDGGAGVGAGGDRAAPTAADERTSAASLGGQRGGWPARWKWRRQC